MEIKKLNDYMRQWIQISQSTKEAEKTPTKRPVSKNVAPSGDRVELSANKLNETDAQRMEKLSKLKLQINQGTYSVPEEEIAKRMLEESW